MITTFKKLGPGLLFAGAAIGVSHLVQSTRAGADFGLGLLWALLLVNLFNCSDGNPNPNPIIRNPPDYGLFLIIRNPPFLARTDYGLRIIID